MGPDRPYSRVPPVVRDAHRWVIALAGGVAIGVAVGVQLLWETSERDRALAQELRDQVIELRWQLKAAEKMAQGGQCAGGRQ